MESRATPLERAWAAFVPRTILGFVYLFAGIHKFTDIGATAFGRQMMSSDAAQFLPGQLLLVLGTLTPFLELGLGALVLIGLWTRWALRALAVLIIAITIAYGVHGLRHPIGATAMDISVVNFYILPRAVLLIVLFFLPREDDVIAVDAILARPVHV